MTNNRVGRSGTGEPTSSPLRVLALGAVAGPALFTLTWLTLGVTSTGYTLYGHTFREYSPVSQPISGLGVGATAPFMNTAFVVTGLMLLVGVVGIVRSVPAAGSPTLRRWALALLACTGIGQALCGVFTLRASVVHGLAFLLAVGTPIVGFVVAGRYLRRVPGWRRLGTGLAVVGSPLALLGLIAYFVAFRPTADGAEHGVAGLIQRIDVVGVHAWFVAMGWRAFREPGSTPPASRPASGQRPSASSIAR
ncbi:DUF998 domain-containing protein [Micromonospora mirobrigensis]|nr:DUF998 domain-containing protein [Micromonospora mirobrigensis]